MRCACYARYSSDLQRKTSADDQVSVCRAYADRHALTWQDEYVYRDEAISGTSLVGRVKLDKLLRDASSTPRPFDILLVDDSSRLARNLREALTILQQLTYHGIRVVFISQGIDTQDEQAEVLFGFHGIVDSLYVREMAKKIRRGLQGQLGRGLATGGVTYGYRTVAVPDPNSHDTPLGFRVAIEPTESQWVRQVFEWYAEGTAFSVMIARLREAGAPAPRGGNSRGNWRFGAVRRLLQNARYLGRLIWGRTRTERRPGTGKKVQRRVAPEEWVTIERPDLRIVSDDVWHRVQRRHQQLQQASAPRRQVGGNLLRGRSGAMHGRALLTGFLTCGVCGGAMSVVTKHPYRGRVYRYYGCVKYAKNGSTVCPNRVTARVEDAERAVLEGVQAEVNRPETLEYIVSTLSTAVEAAMTDRPTRRQALLAQREAVATKIRHLLSVVEGGLTSTAVLQQLRAREHELNGLDVALAEVEAPVARERLTVIPSWVKQQLADVTALLQDHPERAKAELVRLGIRFTVYPVLDVPEGQRPYLRAVGEGNFEVLVGANAPFPLSDRSPLRLKR